MKRLPTISAAAIGALALLVWAWPKGTSAPTAAPSASTATGMATPHAPAGADPATLAEGSASSPESDPATPGAAASPTVPTAPPKPVLLPGTRPLSIHDALIAWQTTNTVAASRLDPFADEALLRLQTPAGMISVDPPTLTLQGVSIGDRHTFAVVNRRVVADGEKVGNWNIERIEADTVWVRNVLGERLALHLDRRTAPPPAAIPGAEPESPVAARVTTIPAHLPTALPPPTQGTE